MAAKTDRTVLKGASIVRDLRDGIDYPALTFKGAAPAKGSTVHVEFDGVIYEAKVHEIGDHEGHPVVRTAGLTPLLPEPASEAIPEALATSDI